MFTRSSPRFVIALACSVFAATATQADEFAGQRWAVLIGVDDYARATDLNYCGADMVALRNQLVAAGFPEKQIKLLHDRADENRFRPFKENIERELALVLKLAERGDMVVVALSGHGVHFGGVSYFCPAETDLNSPATMVSLDAVYDQLKQSQASLKFVVVDACRNDPRVPGQKSLSDPAKEFARALQKPLPQGLILLSSCAPGETSYEEPNFGHGVFMHHLLEGLRGKADSDDNKRVSITELARYVNRGTKVYVADKYSDSQRPYLRGDLTLESLEFEFPSATVVATTNRITEPRLTTTPTNIPASSSLPKTITNSIGMKLNLIPAGEFQMGSNISAEEVERRFKDFDAEAEYYNNEHPQHRVRISKPFYLGVYEVTVGQFRQFVSSADYKTEAESDGEGGSGWNESAGKFEGRDPKYNWRNAGFAQTDSHPVVNVTWNDAVAFCDWLSAKEGAQYRLPSEAEWEYACRAGTKTLYYSGDDPESLAQVGNVADGTARAKYSTWKTISNRDGYVFTAPAGRFEPNSFGLHDMHGNLWEWCNDWYGDQYYETSPSFDPGGPASGSSRVLRGGSWNREPDLVRSAYRSRFEPDLRLGSVGFRVVRIAEPAPTTSSSSATPSKPSVVPSNSEDKKAITNSIGMNLNLIPAGEFMMGSSISADEVAERFAHRDSKFFANEHPQHRVRIIQSFYIGTHEVTVGQYRRFVDATGYVTEPESDGYGGEGWNESENKLKGRDPKYYWSNTGWQQTDLHPVVNVTWNDAVAFCDWLSAKEDARYRLPTEAEWEYACRAGTTTLLYSGNQPESLARVGNAADRTLREKLYPDREISDEMSTDGMAFTAPVGRFEPNRFGLYDMHGNVYEWCNDWYNEKYYGISPDVDPSGPTSGSARVLRGGSWMSAALFARSAYRRRWTPHAPDDIIGFRVVRVAETSSNGAKVEFTVHKDGVGPLRFGMSEQEVIARLGRPKDRGDYDDGDSFLNYKDKGISVKLRSGKLLNCVLYTGIKGGYQKGEYRRADASFHSQLTLDSKYHEIIKVLGKPDKVYDFATAPTPGPIPAKLIDYKKLGLSFSYVTATGEIVYVAVVRPESE